MIVKLFAYDSSSRGITLNVEGETPQEEQILRAIWQHGTMETNKSGCCISWKVKKDGE